MRESNVRNMKLCSAPFRQVCELMAAIPGFAFQVLLDVTIFDVFSQQNNTKQVLHVAADEVIWD